jgi:hypothetical protein
MTDIEQFDLARNKFGGTRRGLQTEFGYFKRCHKDWQIELSKLAPAIEKEWRVRSWLKAGNRFCPPWKNFKTWIYNRCWEIEWPEYEAAQRRNATPATARISEPTPLRDLATPEQIRAIRDKMPAQFKTALEIIEARRKEIAK